MLWTLYTYTIHLHHTLVLYILAASTYTPYLRDTLTRYTVPRTLTPYTYRTHLLYTCTPRTHAIPLQHTPTPHTHTADLHDTRHTILHYTLTVYTYTIHVHCTLTLYTYFYEHGALSKHLYKVVRIEVLTPSVRVLCWDN